MSHLGLPPETAQDETCHRIFTARDTALIHPTPHYVRRGRVCMGRRVACEYRGGGAESASAEGVVPHGGARSATLERMTTLSPARVVRESVSFWAVPSSRPRWLTTS